MTYPAQYSLAPPGGSDGFSTRLSPRERECLLWVARGKTSWEISGILHISEVTVNNMIASARRKLGVASRSQAVARAIALGLIAP